MDPFEGFDRFDFLIEAVFDENPLESFVEDLLEQPVSFDLKFPS